jgi:predicted transcriptional regulator
MTRVLIIRLESGKQRPRISTVRKLTDALGVLSKDLVDWPADTVDE